MAPGAITLTDAEATIQPRIGTVPIGMTEVISNMPAQTVPVISAMGSGISLSNSDGIYLAASGAFNITCQASSVSAVTAAYNYYIDYIIAAS